MDGSSFLSIVFSFLAFLGKYESAVFAPADVLPSFSNIQEIDEPVTSISNAEQGPSLIFIDVFDRFDCKSCDTFVQNTLPRIRESYKENPRVSVRVYFDVTPDNPEGIQAAMAAKCAGDQGKFWEMHAALHDGSDPLSSTLYARLAGELGIEVNRFEWCISTGKHKNAVEDDLTYAQNKHILFSPAIRIGPYRLLGDQPPENVEWIIKKILNF